jgi:hypothetical protein
MKRLSQISSRSIFIIFWLLTTLFFAQMVWWIIFQVREAERAKAFLIQTVERERGWAAEMLNTRYQEIYQAASKIAKELNGAAPNGIILADPAVYSIVMQSALEGGDIGDYPHFRIPSGDDHLLVFLSPEYPLSIVRYNGARETFNATLDHAGHDPYQRFGHSRNRARPRPPRQDAGYGGLVFYPPDHARGLCHLSIP